ncbi:hypothetical protein [bacterium endosymbiont of Bathymodiolus sp. 5 South]|jgi:hypothetical protein|uniref:hypothetical protein n=2 Tax=bacterium endosymbiont of Bathymodiolus sp. 5 South TaxID=1181670 RepID=UPI0011181971|nr:hypothetical protein [bacterium endosymbiont of Bathymodiolus sp. 5 South]VVM22014.1 hypothetical protein BSPWISOXPB_6172 [uncultured Gammaproteobacteria bacterium]VVM28466.1 hypothetical protein BSPWISOXPB_11027 [uncultured Gammaproteobacteria bacterium]
MEACEIMNFKYTLPENLINADLCEFANGGAQVTIRTKDGDIYEKILISNCMWIVAMAGYNELPFKIDDIIEIYQTGNDKNPKQKIDWFFFDKWE